MCVVHRQVKAVQEEVLKRYLQTRVAPSSTASCGLAWEQHGRHGATKTMAIKTSDRAQQHGALWVDVTAARMVRSGALKTMGRI